ncbi:DNA/RNA non-specific endonuclease [Kribbella deserti]|uniref:DNA/RNA non-specific endonuclease n=1 Tax=Kribbella deserti TaxID=1926257 RepID=A0ABV6QWB7_9ACTN
MASDLERIAQGLVDYLDANPRIAADLSGAAAECQELAGLAAELSIILPEAAAVAEYLHQAAHDCGQAAQLSAHAAVIGRTWAVEALGGGITQRPSGAITRDAPAGNLDPVVKPSSADEDSHEAGNAVELSIDLSDAKPDAGPLQQDRALIELSTRQPDHLPTLSAPPPNAHVRVDSKFAYDTDEDGRVVSAEASLDLIDLAHPRDSNAQRKLIGKLPGDHAGHIFARIFQGPGGTMNLVPMQGDRVNLSQYKMLENHWRRIIDAGGTVDISVSSPTPQTVADQMSSQSNIVTRAESNGWKSRTIRRQEDRHEGPIAGVADCRSQVACESGAGRMDAC